MSGACVEGPCVVAVAVVEGPCVEAVAVVEGPCVEAVAVVEGPCVEAVAVVEGPCVESRSGVEGGSWVSGAGAGCSKVGGPVIVACGADTFGWTKKAIAEVPSRENITRYVYEIVYTQLLWFCI